DMNDRLMRADFLWDPSDRTRFRFIAETTDLNRNGSARTLEEIRLTNARPRAYSTAGYQFDNLSHVSGFPGGEVGKWETKSDVTGGGYVSGLKRLPMDGGRDLADTLTPKPITGWPGREGRGGLDP